MFDSREKNTPPRLRKLESSFQSTSNTTPILTDSPSPLFGRRQRSSSSLQLFSSSPKLEYSLKAARSTIHKEKTHRAFIAACERGDVAKVRRALFCREIDFEYQTIQSRKSPFNAALFGMNLEVIEEIMKHLNEHNKTTHSGRSLNKNHAYKSILPTLPNWDNLMFGDLLQLYEAHEGKNNGGAFFSSWMNEEEGYISSISEFPSRALSSSKPLILTIEPPRSVEHHDSIKALRRSNDLASSFLTLFDEENQNSLLHQQYDRFIAQRVRTEGLMNDLGIVLPSVYDDENYSSCSP